MMTLASDVREVLEQKNYAKRCVALDEFVKTVEETAKLNAGKVSRYKWGGLFLSLAIPIISAILSALLNSKTFAACNPEQVAEGLSLFLTVLTIVNSTLKPAEKFDQTCRIGVGIDQFAAGFLAELERIEPMDEGKLLDLVEKKRKELERVRIELIGTFMPVGKPAARH